MSEINLFPSGVSVIAIKKEGTMYAMTCAWGMQLTLEGRALFCIGSQSETGAHLQTGDIVAVSILSEGQQSEASLIGSAHSESTDKGNLIPWEKEGNLFFVEGAKIKMAGKVLAIHHFPGDCKEDYIAEVEPLDIKEDKTKEPLHFPKDFA